MIAWELLFSPWTSRQPTLVLLPLSTLVEPIPLLIAAPVEPSWNPWTRRSR